MTGALAQAGFAPIGRVLDDDDLARLRAAADGLGGPATPGPYGRIHHDPWRRAAVFADLIASRAAPAAIAAIGAPVVLFQDHVIAKTPGTTAAIAWHQDYSYWPLDAPAGLTMWIALDDADEDNGCLAYLPGTHRLGERRPADFTEGAAMPDRADLPPLVVADHEDRAIRVAVAAGDGLVHDPLVWHMSPANRSARPRRAWSITWLRPHVRWDPTHAPHPFTTMSSVRRGDPLAPDRFPVFSA